MWNFSVFEIFSFFEEMKNIQDVNIFIEYFWNIKNEKLYCLYIKYVWYKNKNIYAYNTYTHKNWIEYILLIFQLDKENNIIN